MSNNSNNTLTLELVLEMVMVNPTRLEAIIDRLAIRLKVPRESISRSELTQHINDLHIRELIQIYKGNTNLLYKKNPRASQTLRAQLARHTAAE